MHYLTSPPKKYWFDACKLLYHQDRVKDYLDGKRIMPIHIDMGIHKSCNIRCVYCYGIKQKPSPKFIPTDRLIHLANDAKERGIRSLAIIGDGEPTLNSGLYQFVQHGTKQGIDMSIATNGLLLKEHQIEILTANLVWIRFNISAVNTYDKIMGARKGSLAIFERVVKHAVKHKGECTVGLQMVLIPECFPEVIALSQFAINNGVDYLVIKQFSDPEEGIPMQFDMDEYKAANDILAIAESMSTDKTKIIVKWSAINDTTEITKHKHWGFDRCIDLPFIFQISGDGGCYPCGYLFGNADYCYGNVCTDRLRDILVSEQYWGIVAKVAATQLDRLCRGQCRHCETNKFIDQVKKGYGGDLKQALIDMCGGETQYQILMNNPPEHINFV